ncbi:MAG: hypothetical protein U5K43_01015 [Halofilum sp. (in: g-proteobacteria)]|nr:hypothetical protein [Halofilum sp. (in: g-proteobacteria)]
MTDGWASALSRWVVFPLRAALSLPPSNRAGPARGRAAARALGRARPAHGGHVRRCPRGRRRPGRLVHDAASRRLEAEPLEERLRKRRIEEAATPVADCEALTASWRRTAGDHRRNPRPSSLVPVARGD